MGSVALVVSTAGVTAGVAREAWFHIMVILRLFVGLL